jgi:hypothetical protein
MATPITAVIVVTNIPITGEEPADSGDVPSEVTQFDFIDEGNRKS